MIVALSTCPIDEAKKIAETLVNEKLVASVNVVSNVSTFLRMGKETKWQDETLLIMRTRAIHAFELVKRINELSSFAVPETACFEIFEPDEKYRKWLFSCVKS